MSTSSHDVKPVIGLVGGIGSGKSAVARALARRGGALVEADRLGHEALSQPEILQQVRELWGERVLDANGQVDRKKLGAIVFASPVERTKLERVVHPWIGGRIRAAIERHRSDPAVGFVVLDAAVMLEAGWNRACDKLIYVHAPRPVRVARVLAQRGWNETELMQREIAQWPLTAKATLADAAVDNTCGTEGIEEQVERLLDEWGIHAVGSR
jgi:dephospho-CoA kinase